MSITHVGSGSNVSRSTSHQRHADARIKGTFEDFQLGQRLSLTVLRQLDPQTYFVSMAGEQHVLESTAALIPGGTVHAVVVAVGDRLELRYLSSEQSRSEPEDTDNTESQPPTLLAQLAARYKVSLSGKDRDLLERVVNRASDPAAMALSGLFLAKIGAAVDPNSVSALYSAQSDAPDAAAGATAFDMSALLNAGFLTHGSADTLAAEDTTPLSSLAESMAGALQGNLDGNLAAVNLSADGANSHNAGDEDQAELARALLNTQDGGAVAYRYGSLPVLVSGQLHELDLVLFQQRQPQEGSTQVRRLVMTLDTHALGPLQIEARALDNRLVITFVGRSPEAAAELAPYGRDIRDLATRLGWTVEGVGYEYATGQARAARQIIRHVLAAGTVDTVL